MLIADKLKKNQHEWYSKQMLVFGNFSHNLEEDRKLGQSSDLLPLINVAQMFMEVQHCYPD